MSGRRRWCALGLLFGGVAFVATPVTDVAAAAAGLSQSEPAPSEVRHEPVTPGSLPGLASETLTEPAVMPEAASGEQYKLPVAPEGGAAYDPSATAGSEEVEERTKFSQAFRRSDGLLEVRVSPEPIAYDAGDGRLELIDTSLKPSKEGFEALANEFEVTVGSSSAGVALMLPSGERVVSRPAFLDGVAPERPVEPELDAKDDSVVWYRQVWPGVDVRYVVKASGLAEDVVFTRAPNGAGAVTFNVSGAEIDSGWSLPAPETPLDSTAGFPAREIVTSKALSESGQLGKRPSDPIAEQRLIREIVREERPEGALSSLAARGALGKELRFDPLLVRSGANADVVLDDAAVPLARTQVTGKGESLVEVSVDPTWLQGLPADAFPVVIDPNLMYGVDWWWSYLGGTSSNCGVGSCGMHAGHPMIPGYGLSLWRSMNLLNLGPQATAYGLYGGGSWALLNAAVVLTQVSGYSGASTVNLHVATAGSHAGAVGGPLLGSFTSSTQYLYDVTGHVRGKLAAGDSSFSFGLDAWAEFYNFKEFGFGIVLLVNDAPPVPVAEAPSPTNGSAWFAPTSSSLPTFQVAPVTDTTLAAGWSVPKYHFTLSTVPLGTTDYWGNVASRASENSRTFALPPSLELRDGFTYYWRAWASDGVVMTPSPQYSFRYDRRLGTSGPSPYTDVGAVKVNPATGNAMFTWSQRSVATLGGGASVSLTYNSLHTSASAAAHQQPGLPKGWTASWGTLPVAKLDVDPAGGSAVVRLADGGKEAFVNQAGSWRPTDPLEHSILRTTTTSPATYQWENETGWVANFDAVGNVTAATHQGDDLAPTSLVFDWGSAGTPAVPVLRKVSDPVVPSNARAMNLRYGSDPQCPALSSAETTAGNVKKATASQLCLIDHMDGSKALFRYTLDEMQIARIVDDGNGDFATVADDDQVVWDLGWLTAHRIGSIRDPLTNRQIANGVFTASAAHETKLTYDGTSRIETVTGPVPDATHPRPGVAFAYPPGSLTTATDINRTEPNGFTTRWTTDARGRAVKVEDRLQRAVHTRWVDADTDRVAWTDSQSLTAAGAPSFLRTGSVYDDRGRPLQAWGPAPRSEFGATTEANGTATGGVSTPMSSTEYDGGLTGLALTFWSNTTQAGKPAGHGHMPGAQNVTYVTPHTNVTPENWSMRATGSIRFPSVGTYTMHMLSFGPTRYQLGPIPQTAPAEPLTIPGDFWSYVDPGSTGGTTPTFNVTIDAASVNKWIPITIDSANSLGAGGISTRWVTPAGGAPVVIPSANLRPEFGLPTTTTARVSPALGDTQTTAVSYDDPATASVNESYLGIARVTTADPGGLNRQTIETFEAPGSGFLRRTSRQLPSGAGSKVNYTHYTPTAGPIASGATACGIPGSTNQLGMLQRTTQADPDGSGGDSALVREYVYDAAGRQAGYRASTNIASEPWTCTTFDDAGRVDTVNYPAFGSQPPRSVTHNYMVGGNPNVASVTDPAGTITTTGDYSGRAISTTDVWGFTTTVSYDNNGRVTTASNPAGIVGYSYDVDDKIVSQTLNGAVVATPAYDTLGRMAAVTYPAGVGNGGNGTTGAFSFDDYGRPAGVTWSGPSGQVTSDAVTSRDQLNRIVNRSTDGHDPNGATPNFDYSKAGELVTAVGFAAAPGPSAATRSFAYGYAATGGCGIAPTSGANVNRTSKTIDGGTPVTYCYDHADRLTATNEPAEVVSTAAGTLTYDAHGNTSRLGDEAYEYDVADRHLKTSASGPLNAASAVQIKTTSSKCFDVEGPSAADGAVLQQWSCNSPSVAQQRWDLVAVDGEWSNLVSHLSGKCIGPLAGGTADGTKLTQRGCDTADQALQFKLVPSGSGWRLTSRPSGKCVDVPSGSSTDGVDLQILTCATGTSASKQFTLHTAATGATVAPGSVAASATSVVPPAGLTNVQLRSRGSWKCGDVRGPSSADDTVVQQWSCNSPAVAQQSVDLVADGAASEMRVRFRNANKCAQARTGDTVTQNTCDGGSDQRWKFTERPGGWRIESKWNNKCLAATGGDGTGLTLVTCADAATQLWSITSPTNGSIVEVDGPGTTSVAYTRDAADVIVQRSLNGAVTGRYASSASGAPMAVLNGSNVAVSATLGLPGGTSLSFDPRVAGANGTWQHPSLTGHRVATTTTSGAKLGGTTVYDPDGNLQAGTLPDDKPGSFDAAWHGGGGVNLEHQSGLHPMIQMGARQYSPSLARFLEVDPVEGGVNNDYGYVSDTVNGADLTGLSSTTCDDDSWGGLGRTIIICLHIKGEGVLVDEAFVTVTRIGCSCDEGLDIKQYEIFSHINGVADSSSGRFSLAMVDSYRWEMDHLRGTTFTHASTLRVDLWEKQKNSRKKWVTAEKHASATASIHRKGGGMHFGAVPSAIGSVVK